MAKSLIPVSGHSCPNVSALVASRFRVDVSAGAAAVDGYRSAAACGDVDGVAVYVRVIRAALKARRGAVAAWALLAVSVGGCGSVAGGSGAAGAAEKGAVEKGAVERKAAGSACWMRAEEAVERFEDGSGVYVDCMGRRMAWGEAVAAGGAKAQGITAGPVGQ